MTSISLAEWGRLMDAGATTYTVGKVPGPYTAFLDRTEAEAAAGEHGGRFIEWAGRTGRELAADYETYLDPYIETEPAAESELEA